MSEPPMTTEELIAKVRATRDKASAVADELRYLVTQLRKQIDREGEADDRKHA